MNCRKILTTALPGLLAIGIFSMTQNATALDLQGHRGARGLLPENTLVAFARALSIGVSTLELDVGISRDNVVVVNHNAELSAELTRDKSGQWLTGTGPALRTLSLVEIKSYDVGRIKPDSRYQRRFPNQQPVDGARIPTLEEVILLIKKSGNTTVRLNIETKLNPFAGDSMAGPAEFAASVIAVVAKHGFGARVTLQSFDWRSLKEAQRLAPEMPTSYLTASQTWTDNLERGRPGASPWTAGFDIDDYDGDIPATIKAAGGHVWSPYHKEVNATVIKRAHALGLKVKVWTVNDKARMGELIDMGVDGIITDYPDMLRAVMQARKMALPAATPVEP
jgi:glycerophosphoryl diester phosphodiesterase